jgi:hypothetical protein
MKFVLLHNGYDPSVGNGPVRKVWPVLPRESYLFCGFAEFDFVDFDAEPTGEKLVAVA